MPSATLYPAVSSDNGYANDQGEFFSGGYGASYLAVGRYGEWVNRSWLRIALTGVPAGAIISAASLDLTANTSLSGATAMARVSAAAADDAAAPASASAAMAMASGEQYVDWTMPAMTAGTTYSPPDLAAVIQEFIDRPGYTPGAHIVLLLSGDASSTHAYRFFDSLGYSGGTYKPALAIEWREIAQAPAAGMTLHFPAPSLPFSPARISLHFPAPAMAAASQAPAAGMGLHFPIPRGVAGIQVPAGRLSLHMPRPLSVWAIPADQMPAAQTIYTLTLTGAANGLADITIPMASFQTRLNEGGVHYLSAVIPNSRRWADAISARDLGQWIVRKGYRLQGGAESLSEIVRVGFTSLGWSRGSSGDSATIYGNETVPVVASKSVTVTGVQYESLDTSGKRRVRCDVSKDLAPGDWCIWPGGSMQVGGIVHYVGAKMGFMEVAES